jgi:hypothetical protein
MIGDRDAFFDEVLNSLIIQRYLAMAGEMFEMGFDDRHTLPHDRFHHRIFVIGRCLAFDNRDRSLGAGPYTGTKTITEEIADKPCLPVDELKGSLRAVRDALAAACAFVFINTDYVPFH